jgi:radical SAM superfamily enzyme YgiQ (UPF0313 family)
MGLAKINSSLNTNSIQSEIFDLDIMVKYHNSLKKQRLFVDLEYLRTNYSALYSILKATRFDEYMDSQFDKILQKMNLSNIDVVGLNSMHNEIYFPLYLAKKIKKHYGCAIVIGGIHISRIPEEKLLFLKNDIGVDYVDHFIRDDPTSFFLSLDKDYSFSKQSSGLEMQSDYTGHQYNKEHLDLYRIEMDKIEYFYPNLNKNLINRLIELRNAKPLLILPYQFIEGCSNKCAFCYNGGNTHVHAKEPERVLSDLQALQKDYRCHDFYFLNNNIMADKEYSMKLFKMLSKETSIKWSDCASINYVDDTTATLMNQSGCISLLFGLESGSQRILRYVNKNSGYNRLEYYTRCFNVSDKNNIWVGATLIVGFPFERKMDYDATVSFLEANRHLINGVYVFPFILFRNSLIYQNIEAFRLRLADTNEVAEHIQKRCQGDVFSEVFYMHHPFHEIGGLSWQARLLQMNHYYEKLRNHIDKMYPTKFYHHYPLYVLYDTLKNKKDILNWLQE